MVLSEGAGCISQRVPYRARPDALLPAHPANTSLPTDRAIPTCLPQSNAPGLLPYVAGALGVWTLFDYLGEPWGGWELGYHAWPAVSSNYGQYDLAGFPKPHVWWYVAKWLHVHAPSFVASALGTSSSSDGGTPDVSTPPTVRLLDLLDNLVPAPPGSVAPATAAGLALPDVCVLSVLGTRPPVQTVELLINGFLVPPPASISSSSSSASSSSSSSSVPYGRLALSDAGDDGVDTATLKWHVPCLRDAADAIVDGTTQVQRWRLGPGTRVEARGRDASGAAVASHARVAPSVWPTQLTLVVDVPSEATATGVRLLLDGRDTALLRASLRDDTGALVSAANAHVSFEVRGGPGRVVGTGNGNPHSHARLAAASVDSFGGLARGLVRASVDCASDHREIMRFIDVDGSTPTLVQVHAVTPPDVHEPIVVRATATLLLPSGATTTTTTLTAHAVIPVSCDASVDGAVSVARQQVAAGPLDFAYLRDFDG